MHVNHIACHQSGAISLALYRWMDDCVAAHHLHILLYYVNTVISTCCNNLFRYQKSTSKIP